MYCKNCGTRINDNAAFCEKCGTAADVRSDYKYSCAVKMSKKEYFASDFRTDSAKTYRTANWILFAVMAAFLVFSIVISAIGTMAIFEILDSDLSLTEFIEKLEVMSDGEIYFTEEDYDMFRTVESELGVSVMPLMKVVMYTTVIVMMAACIVTVLFALFAVLRTNTGCAIASLVLAVLFSGSWIVIGIAVAMLVMIIKLNNEYEQYSKNYLVFCQNGSKEPDFSV